MPPAVEQVLGAALILVVLLDVFLTVLYARMGTGLLGRIVPRLVWRCIRVASRPLGRRRAAALSVCGPAVLVALLGTWAGALALGAALIIHPALGTAVRVGSGETPRDFVTALLAGGSSMSIVSAGDFSPHTSGYKLLYLCFSLIGLSVTSLTLTYLMQVYTALQRRNALGLRLHLLTAGTGDAAELVAGLGPEGKFDGGYSVLAELASTMASVKEAHHFYPLLFYFRFAESYYSVSQTTLLALDAVSLVRSALDEEQLAWLQESAATTELWGAALILATALEEHFAPADARARGGAAEPAPDERTLLAWRERYDAALRRLGSAHVPTTRDPRGGFEVYQSLRTRWDAHIAALAPAMAYDRAEVDPAGTNPHGSDRRAAFTARRYAAG